MANAPDDWFLARWLRGGVATEPEPADLGTAFGLDISVQPLPDEPAAPAADVHPGGWLERMRLRPR
jgi:hypothetical protein